MFVRLAVVLATHRCYDQQHHDLSSHSGWNLIARKIRGLGKLCLNGPDSDAANKDLQVAGGCEYSGTTWFKSGSAAASYSQYATEPRCHTQENRNVNGRTTSECGWYWVDSYASPPSKL
ncbi:hypothetical protein PG985_009494 [Apiospora marii]|uniref:Secreted protein n=1 Tax=Apiospora marii TaxID=335849 RepID=A0ABR1RFI8_9PEZI